MIDPKLLEILACPVTHQSLTEASAEMLETINAKIRAGMFKNVGGAVVEKELTAALVREGNTLAYPITDGIPVLLENEGLSLE